MAKAFIPGLELSQILYEHWIAPLVKANWPQLAYSAALLGDGSEVLGFDNITSTDHDWGPRLYLFLKPEDFSLAQKISSQLETILPETIEGFPVQFEDLDRPKNFDSNQQGGSSQHGVEFFTLPTFFQKYLGIELEHLTHHNWLNLPEALLLSVTEGQVFYDKLGLKNIQKKLKYYPHDIWLYKMAAQWVRISQEEAFFGRCYEVGDPLGSQIILTRLIRDLMYLCFIQEKRYVPYNKWFGKGFQQLACSAQLEPIFLNAIKAPTYKKQEDYLSQAYQLIARQHNALKLTDFIDPDICFYYTRPYQVIRGERFAYALKAQIKDPQIVNLPLDIGSINQYIDSTDILTRPELCQKQQYLY